MLKYFQYDSLGILNNRPSNFKASDLDKKIRFGWAFINFKSYVNPQDNI